MLFYGLKVCLFVLRVQNGSNLPVSYYCDVNKLANSCRNHGEKRAEKRGS